MAAGKAGTGPILPQALELAQSGFALKEAKGHPTVYEVQSLRKVPLRKNQGMNPGV
jgi:hypothetical protein